jgi:nucleotide-binding universal stress UspA family protein
LIVACVCSSRPAYDRSGGQIEEDLIEEAAAALAQLERELAPESVAISYRQPEGTSAARALHETAENEDAGLLVVGSTRRAALGRLLPGSTADRLMHGAPCPIAVIPTGWQLAAPSPRSASRTSIPPRAARRCAERTRSPAGWVPRCAC